MKMKILYYDCFCGICGDMHLAALLDLGVPKEHLLRELSRLNLESKYKIKIEQSEKQGIRGTRVDVLIMEEKSEENENHRNLKDIENIINSSNLNENIKKISLKIFMKVAEAEATVHGKTIYEVNFEKAGAIDSIVDIVGAAICIDYFKVDKIISSKVQLGGGYIKCVHGIMPVPTPATIEILKGIPIKTGLVDFETTTPTGAAILAANVEKFSSSINFKIKKTGYGIGHRDLVIPNVLRVYLGEKNNNDEIEDKCMIEIDIKDLTPDYFKYVEGELYKVGSLDKKNNLKFKKSN